VLTPTAWVHLEQLVVEVHSVLTTERIERAQRRGTQPLVPSGVQADERGRLELKPTDDLHDTAMWTGRFQNGSVDVEHHQQPFTCQRRPTTGVVIGQAAHPVAH
jgi:hypothetical protein